VTNIPAEIILEKEFSKQPKPISPSTETKEPEPEIAFKMG